MAISKIITGSLTDDAVTAAKIPAGGVTTADIADDAVTGGKLANDIAISTTGNIATTGSGTLISAGAFTASGGIANAGTITAGTLGANVVVPASVGSSMVLIKSETAPTTVNWDVEDCFSSSYDSHIISMVNIGTSGLTNINFRLIKTDGTILSTSKYTWQLYGQREGAANYQDVTVTDDKCRIGNRVPAGGTPKHGANYHFQIAGTNSATQETNMTGTCIFFDNTHASTCLTYTMRFDEVTQCDGIRIYSDSSETINKGRISVYGLKHS